MSTWWHRWRRLLTTTAWVIVLVRSLVRDDLFWTAWAGVSLGCQLKWGYDEPFLPSKTSDRSELR